MVSPAFCTNCGRPLASGEPCAACSPSATAAAASGLEPAYEVPLATETRSVSAAGYVEPAPALAYAGSAGSPNLTRYSGMWNWGAFFLCPFWLMNHGAVPLGIVALVLSFVPLVNFVASLGFGIYFGIKGNDWAASHRAFASDAQFVAVQNAWRNWGFGLAVLGFALSVAAFVLGAMAHAFTPAMR